MDHHTCSRATAVPCRIDYFIRRRPHSLQRTRRAALRARAAGGVLLAFDFDGTLAPIANRPERAHDRAHAKAAGSGSTGALALRTRGVVLTLSPGLCFVPAYLALLAGLAPIVGAFAAGLVLEEVHFEGQAKRGEPPLHESLEPLIALLVPVFFVRMGMLVDLRSFASTSVLGFAALLTVAAVLGKLACALATPKGIPRLTVGLGMMPRGEVGLIFACIGAQLVFADRPVIDAGTCGGGCSWSWPRRWPRPRCCSGL